MRLWQGAALGTALLLWLLWPSPAVAQTQGPPPTGSKLSDVEVAKLLAYVGFAGDDLETATRIVLGESGGNPKAKNYNSNSTTDWGLAQVNDVNLPFLRNALENATDLTGADLLDPVTNAWAMFALWQQYGWKPWHGATKLHTLKADGSPATGLIARAKAAVLAA